MSFNPSTSFNPGKYGMSTDRFEKIVIYIYIVPGQIIHAK